MISFAFVNSTLHLKQYFVMLTLQICNKKNSWQYFRTIFFVEKLVNFRIKIDFSQNNKNATICISEHYTILFTLFINCTQPSKSVQFDRIL